MTIKNVKYGICVLPENCIAYSDGYKYGAYQENLDNKRDAHIVEFFKTKEEVQLFVNANKEYRKQN